MARILAISSQVVWGPVGNTAAVPALQAMGHEVMQVPTVLLSNHPGHGKPAGQATDAKLFRALLGRVQELAALATCDAVSTGYFASVDQVTSAAEVIARLRPRLIVVDPVIGDHGALYVSKEIAAAIREHLLPLATIATPNVFELGWLTGLQADSHDEAVIAARKLGPTEVIVTSVREKTGELETILVTPDSVLTSAMPEREHVPHGTGDFLAGLYLAERVEQGRAIAFSHAMDRLQRAIELSAGSPVLKVAQALRS